MLCLEAKPAEQRISRYFYILLSVFLTSCANEDYGSNQYFERDKTVIESTKTIAVHKDLATVYFFREARPLQYNSIFKYSPTMNSNVGNTPPVYYALDEVMISIMPLGSYIKLSLIPGKHSFTTIDFNEDQLYRNDVELELKAGKIYYIGTQNKNFWRSKSESFGLVDVQLGVQIVLNTRLAKLLIQPVSTDDFISKLYAVEEKHKADITRKKSAQIENESVDDRPSTEESNNDNSQGSSGFWVVFGLQMLETMANARANSLKDDSDSSSISIPPSSNINNQFTHTRNTSGIGYWTRDANGALVNSHSNYQTIDANGARVNSQSNYQTFDVNGIQVDSNDCFWTKDNNGALVSSNGCNSR